MSNKTHNPSHVPRLLRKTRSFLYNKKIKMAAPGKMTPKIPFVNTAKPAATPARMVHLSADAGYLYALRKAG